jgi:hypothetical protein
MDDDSFPDLEQAPEESARSVFLAWEKLRLVYNAVLVVFVLLIPRPFFDVLESLIFLAEGAFIANLCYCAGPVAEGYLALLGADRSRVRLVLFVLGTLLACALAAVAVVYHAKPIFA